MSIEIAFAVIADISHSRSHANRDALQAQVSSALGSVNGLVQAVEELGATIGDEFQGVYADLPTALRATLLAQLSLPTNVECRFGIGAGDLRVIGQGKAGNIQDGPAWWSARAAVNIARTHQYSKLRFVRTWYETDRHEKDPSPADGASITSYVNAYLLSRDHLISEMKPRERRLFLGHLLGTTQAQLAEIEGITQSAVSQNLRRSGALALLAGEELLHGRTS